MYVYNISEMRKIHGNRTRSRVIFQKSFAKYKVQAIYHMYVHI